MSLKNMSQTDKEQTTAKENDFLLNYLLEAPTPLAIERSWECSLLSKQHLQKPILDVGCGDGIFAKILSKTKIDVGIDPNPIELTRAAKVGFYDELLECFGNEIQKSDNSFATIFSNSVLEHIEDLQPVLIEVRRLLTQNGTFYVTLPTDNFEKFTLISCFFEIIKARRASEIWHRLYNKFWQHHHCYDSEKWKSVFREAGFKVVSVKFYGTKNQCLLNDIMVPFCIFSFINRKFFKRWFVLNGLRELLVKTLIYPAVKRISAIQIVEEKHAGLVLIELKK